MSKRHSLAAACVMCLVFGVAVAQAQPSPGMFGRRGGGLPGGGGTLMLLQSKEVRKSLGIIEDEQAYIQLLSEEIRDKFRNTVSQLRELSPDEHAALLR